MSEKNYILDKSYSEKNDYLVFIILILITFLSRYLIVSSEFHGYGWDPGNFALATKSFSILQTRPHWPGYFLHVQIIKIMDIYFQNTFKTMILISIFYSSLGISLFYILLRNWFKFTESLLISSILMTNPLVWYYGCVSEMYSFEILFSVLLILLSIKNKLICLTPILMGIGSGIRPSSAVLLFPLYVFLWYSFYKKNNISIKYFILSHTAGLIFLFGWFLPLTNYVGGITSYFKIFLTHSPIQKITFFQNLVQFLIYMLYPLYGIIIGFLFLVFRKIYYKNEFSLTKIINFNLSIKNFIWILFWWIIPPILFFVIFHYSKGTLLLCMAGIISLIPILFLNERFRSKFYIFLILTQTSFFLFANYKLPNVQTYFINSKRNINLTEVLKDRLESNYLLSKSSINNMQSEFKIMHEIIRDFKNDSLGLNSSKKYLLIDPTCTLSPRALQAQYPKITFTKISPQNSSIFGKFQNLDLISDQPLSKMLSKAIIFSRKDFVDNYLQNINITRKDYNYWSVYIPSKNDIKLLENLYTNYFDRSQLN